MSFTSPEPHPKLRQAQRVAAGGAAVQPAGVRRARELPHRTMVAGVAPIGALNGPRPSPPGSTMVAGVAPIGALNGPRPSAPTLPPGAVNLPNLGRVQQIGRGKPGPGTIPIPTTWMPPPPRPPTRPGIRRLWGR
jgi:hypothetical protein